MPNTNRVISSPIFIILSIVFFLSGFSTLIYQVVWQRLLTLFYGVGFISTTIIVTVYMFGLGVGALIGGVLAERSQNRIQLFAGIEFLVGLFGIASISFLEWLGTFTVAVDYKWMISVMFLYLCLPTVLMGMTLPILTKIVNQWVKDYFKTVSFLYFLNTIGAALGALAAAYIFITFWGLDTAVYVAAIINLLLAFCIFAVRKSAVYLNKESFESTETLVHESIWGKKAYSLVLMTGFLAVGYEIVWFRFIGVLIKASAYAFSTILFVYLLGIALGSFTINRYLSKIKQVNLKQLFCKFQFFIGIFVLFSILGLYLMATQPSLQKPVLLTFEQIIHPPLYMGFGEMSFYQQWDVFLWPFFFMFVPTLFMGATFPLIAQLALSDNSKDGQTTGTVYFFNIAGNVLGALITGFILLPIIGTERTLFLFVMAGLAFGFFLQERWAKRIIKILLFVSVGIGCLMIHKGDLYKAIHFTKQNDVAVEFEEGREGVVLTVHHANGYFITNYINGMPHGGRPVNLFYEQTIEALSYARKRDHVLIIGFGAGAITETVLNVKDISKVTLVELNRSLIKNLNKIPLLSKIFNNPKLDIKFDDARRYLLRNNKKFDLILMDPLRATTAYSNNLYSREFMRILSEHLNPGGTVMIWTDEYLILPKTFRSEFDHIRIYDKYCLMSNSPMVLDKKNRTTIHSFFPKRLIETASKARLKGGTAFIDQQLQHIPANSDYKPYSEYYLGRSRLYRK